MPIFFYNIFLVFYRLAIGIAAIWNQKAEKWVKGRKGIFDHLHNIINKDHSNAGRIWIHCSSLGEFEQGQPVIEQCKALYPDHQVLISFFSPSGYEIKKNYPGADHVVYLPMDSKKNAQQFLDIIKPSLVIFVKYDLWYYYLDAIRKRNINALLVSAIFRPDQSFFRWWGSLQRKMLQCFTEIFVQNHESCELLNKIGITHCTVSGDTRFDRVIEIAEKFIPIPEIQSFTANHKVLVAGSTWKEDEDVLQHAFLQIKNEMLKFIIAPHEINEKHLTDLKKNFPGAIFFSEIKNITNFPSVLIIDNIGMLSRLYKYGEMTYVGGGFTRDGVHNVLEAAVYGKPVFFGNNYGKYREAVELIQSGGGESFSTTNEFYEKLNALLHNEELLKQKCKASANYVSSKKGATRKIIQFIQEKRLLTR